jgi:ATP-binding cassette subfamily C exporter for protease/lipase
MFSAQHKHPGSGAHAAMADLRVVGDCLQSPVVGACMEAPAAILFLGLLFAIHPLLAGSAVAAAGAQAAVAWRSRAATQAHLLASQQALQGAQRYALSAFGQAQAVRAMGMLSALHQRWSHQHTQGLLHQAQAGVAQAGYQAAAKCLQNVAGSSLLGLGAWLVLRGALEGGAGQIIVGSVLGGRVLAPLATLVAQWRTVVLGLDAWRRLGHLLAHVPPRQAGMALPAPTGRLQVDQLLATAPGSQRPILHGLTFALQPGEVLAVVGPSGAGKSTLARLLLGVWPASSGVVRLDGAEIARWDKAELGRHLGYLPQEVGLFDGTVADNIARFGPTDLAQVRAAAQAVGLESAIQALPLGYDSPVGRDGSMLSGGLRQRIGIARALYGQPAFVVLDEPDANLDAAGDAALRAAIGQLRARGTTVVVITHRSKLLAMADRLLILHEGQARAFGPRDPVLAALAKANAAVAAPASAAARPGGTAAFRVV